MIELYFLKSHFNGKFYKQTVLCRILDNRIMTRLISFIILWLVIVWDTMCYSSVRSSSLQNGTVFYKKTHRGKRGGINLRSAVNKRVTECVDGIVTDPNELIRLSRLAISERLSIKKPTSVKPRVLINIDTTSHLPAFTPAFKTALINCQSLNGKSNSILETIVESKLSLALLTETWINENSNDIALHHATPDGYTFIQAPRKGTRKGGGVAIISRSLLHPKDISHSYGEFSSFEYLVLSLRIDNKTTNICVLYRPPPLIKITLIDTSLSRNLLNFLKYLSQQRDLSLSLVISIFIGIIVQILKQFISSHFSIV